MKTILITGASRGLGLEFARQLSARGDEVIATCRHPQQAEVLQDLATNRKNLSIVTLDVSDDLSIERLIKILNDRPVDWVINNAGIIGTAGVTLGNVRRENFLNVMNVNCLGAVKVSEAFLPNLVKGEDKLIVTISSRLGIISDNQQGYVYAYRASKAALNCVMRSIAIDAAQFGINVLLLDPGWVKTELGGPKAEIDVADSVSSMLKVIEAKKANSHAEVMYTFAGKKMKW